MPERQDTGRHENLRQTHKLNEFVYASRLKNVVCLLLVANCGVRFVPVIVPWINFYVVAQIEQFDK